MVMILAQQTRHTGIRSWAPMAVPRRWTDEIAALRVGFDPGTSLIDKADKFADVLVARRPHDRGSEIQL